MTIGVIVCLLAGIIIGRTSPWIINFIDFEFTMNACIAFMLVFVGISLYFGDRSLKAIKAQVKDVLIIVLGATFGSILMAIIVGSFLGFNFAQAAAIGVGLGWYSFVGVVLSNTSTYLGTVAFLSNAIRELFAIVGMRLYMKKWGKRAAVSTAGSTAIDTSLGVITKYAGKDYAITSILCGSVLSLVTPIVIGILTPFF